MNDKIYLNVYSVTRHFGGHEEGGWWFNAGEPLESTLLKCDVNDDAAVDREIAAAKERWKEINCGKISSVHGGVEVQVMIQRFFAAAYPEYIPHYE